MLPLETMVGSYKACAATETGVGGCVELALEASHLGYLRRVGRYNGDVGKPALRIQVWQSPTTHQGKGYPLPSSPFTSCDEWGVGEWGWDT